MQRLTRSRRQPNRRIDRRRYVRFQALEPRHLLAATSFDEFSQVFDHIEQRIDDGLDGETHRPIVGNFSDNQADINLFDASFIDGIAEAYGDEPLGQSEFEDLVVPALESVFGEGTIGLESIDNGFRITLPSFTVNRTIDNIGIDTRFGLPYLPIEMTAEATIDVGFDMSLGEISIDYIGGDDPTFELSSFDAHNLSVGISATLETDDDGLALNFGFLKGSLTELEDVGGQNVSQISTTLEIDLGGEDPVELDASAELYLHVASDTTLDFLPAIESDVIVEFESGDFTAPNVEFRNVSVDLGSAVSTVLSPVGSALEPILDPINRFIDLLQDDLPGTGFVGGISLFDLAKNMGPLAPYVNFLAKVQTFSNLLGTNDFGSAVVNVGDFDLNGNTFEDVGILSELDTDVLQEEAVALTSYAANNLGLGDFEDELIDAINGLFSGDIEDVEQLAAELAGNVGIDPVGFSFRAPIIDDPKQAVFGILLGQPKDLIKVTWEPLAVTETDFNFFAIPVGPVTFSLDGHFEPDVKIEVGLDTRGIATTIAGAGTPLDGFWLSEDTRIALDAGITASGTLGIGNLFSFGPEGTISADIGIFAPEDDDPDNKNYFTTFGPCLMSAEGSLNANLSLVARVGVEILGKFRGFEHRKNLVGASTDFHVGCVENPFLKDPEEEPILGEVDDEVLTLFVGTMADERNVEDSPSPGASPADEYFIVRSLDDGGVAVYYGGFRDEFSADDLTGVTTIMFHADDGNDELVVENGVLLDIDFVGGSGEDKLTYAGTGSVMFDGGHQDDSVVLTQAARADLEGGLGEDTFTLGDTLAYTAEGGSNDDTFYLGSGCGTVWGDDGDDLVLVGNGPATINGGHGSDEIIGGAGVSSVHGGPDDDLIFAGDNGDTIDGELGADTVFAGPGDDLVRVLEASLDEDLVVWEAGDGNLVVEGAPQINLQLSLSGSEADEMFHVRDGKEEEQMHIDALGKERTILATYVTTLSVDGRHGEDEIVVDPLSTSSLQTVNLNMGDNLDNDELVDLIDIKGTGTDDDVNVDSELAVLMEVPTIPENELGNVMEFDSINTYVVYAMNLADDVRLRTFKGEDVVHLEKVIGPFLLDTGRDDDVVTSDSILAPTIIRTANGDDELTVNVSNLTDYSSPIEYEAGGGAWNLLTVDFSGLSQPFAPTSRILVSDHAIIHEVGVATEQPTFTGIEYQATGGFDAIRLNGSGFDDTIRVTSSLDKAVTRISTGSGDDVVVVTSTTSNDLKGDLNGIAGDLSLVNSSGDDQLAVSDWLATSGNQDVRLFGNTMRNFAGADDKAEIFGSGFDWNIYGSDDASLAEAFVVEGFAENAVLNAGAGDDSVRLDELDANATLEVHGQAGDDELFGLKQSETWTILDAYAGHIVGEDGAAVSFDGVERGEARDGDDEFVFWTGGQFDEIDGGGGFDQLNYVKQNGPVLVNLRDSQAHGVSGNAVKFEFVHGSKFDDTLIGDDADNLLTGDDGNDILIGHAGDDVLNGGLGRDLLVGGEDEDILVGGFGQDIMIGGPTVYDKTPGAPKVPQLDVLDEIRLVWIGPGSFAERMSLIASGDGLSDGAKLDDETVLDDGIVDLIIGASDEDWVIE